MAREVAGTTSDARDTSRLFHERLPDVTEVVEERPRTGKEHADATSCHLDPRGNFDQPHPPRASVTFTLRVGFASAVEVSTAYTARTCFNGNGIWFERVAWIFFRGRIGDLLS